MKLSEITTAEAVKNTAPNSTRAMEMAASLSRNIDHDWDNETTTFTFIDKSVLIVSGPEYVVGGDA